jgi:hypothetical protein
MTHDLHELNLIQGGLEDYVRFQVIKVVTMKNAVFWDVVPCGSCVNRRF